MDDLDQGRVSLGIEEFDDLDEGGCHRDTFGRQRRLDKLHDEIGADDSGGQRAQLVKRLDNLGRCPPIHRDHA
jgi:hypothetical protein